jgi:hypothetical protein
VTAYDLIASLSGDLHLTLGPGQVEGTGIPGLKRFLFDGSRQDGAPIDRSLVLPFDVFDAEATLSRGILGLETGQLSVSTATEKPVTALLSGNLDLLLWIADLSLTSHREGSDGTSDRTKIYQILGPPYRPSGVINDGN